MLLALVLVPLLGAAGAYVHRSAAYRTVWLVVTAALHAAIVTLVCLDPPPAAFDGWIGADALGLVVLALASGVFLLTSLYTVGYLRHEDPRGGRAFVSCLLGFLAAASLVAVSQHLALLWVGMESATLAVAPLVYHRSDRRSLDAVWKYLMLSSVGIALALLGTFFLATAQSAAGGRALVLDDLLASAGALHPAWLKGAFVFLLVGYGTKMGLAPLHAWKPDTYGEAPALVGGLMAGVLTACGFLGVARITEVTAAAGLAAFTGPLLIAFGLASLVVAATMMFVQRDLKRLLAYSSVEHMGLLALGLGLGGAGAFGAVLHLVNNALVKPLLFLVAGNLALLAGRRGGGRPASLTRALLFVGLVAVAGSPPFGLFISEFTIVRAALAAPWIAATMLVLLAAIFAGLARRALALLHGAGTAPDGSAPAPAAALNAWLLAGPVVLAVALLALGLTIPAPLGGVLSRAAAALGGGAP